MANFPDAACPRCGHLHCSCAQERREAIESLEHLMEVLSRLHDELTAQELRESSDSPEEIAEKLHKAVRGFNQC